MNIKYIGTYKNKKIKTEMKILLLIFLMLAKFIVYYNTDKLTNVKANTNKIKRVGVVNLPLGLNVGNILVKYSMFKILEQLGVNSTIIIPKIGRFNFTLSFLKETINSHLLFVGINFTELFENDFDYIMVNSDETWQCDFGTIACYNIALLKFAENWKAKKFIYAASKGRYNWPFKNYDKSLIKNLLQNFSGISFREKGMVKILEDNIGLKSQFVLDPTFLLNREYYLNIIKNNKYNELPKDKFIFIYQLDKNACISRIIKKVSETFNFQLIYLPFREKNFIEKFILYLNNSHAVITDSFHGTVFSIIFNKPFISFVNKGRGKVRFYSLKSVFDLKNRIVEPSSSSNIDINLLIKPLVINHTEFNEFKKFSINYLKRQLDIV